MLDATCAPSNIRYPQDFSLLNEARDKLETIIIRFCKSYGFSRPRMYRRQARKNYLALAKAKKRSTKKIRATIRKQLAYIKRDIGYLESYMEEGYAPTSKEISLLMTIYKLYEQQQYMYQNKVHSVENCIVSISQPWIRPIVRGKTKAPVEFGAKFDLSIDDSGLGRIEKISYDAYNESTVLVEAVERFRNELVITQNAYWQTRYIEPETTEISVSFMEYDYLVQSLGDQALQNNHQKRKSRNIRITPIELR